MSRFFHLFTETLAASVGLIPLFLLLNRYRFQNRTYAAACFLFALYLSGVYSAAGLPNAAWFRFYPNVNLRPFLYMFSDLDNTLLNVLLFIPLGFFLTILWLSFRSVFHTVVVGLAFSLVIELLQLFAYRTTDINDLMTNTLGTLLGYLLGRLFTHVLPYWQPDRNTKDLGLILSCVIGVMLFVQPLFSDIFFSALRLIKAT